MSNAKRQKPVFHRFGTVDFVETGSTGTNLVGYGTSVCAAGIFTLDPPSAAGTHKMLILTSSNAEVQTGSSATVFLNSTFNRISASTELNDTVFVPLIGGSTAAWYVDSALQVQLSTAGILNAYTIAATTHA